LKYIRIYTVTLLELIKTKLPVVVFVEGAKDLVDELHHQHMIELQLYRKRGRIPYLMRSVLIIGEAPDHSRITIEFVHGQGDPK
jgi:hypothetical protein